MRQLLCKVSCFLVKAPNILVHAVVYIRMLMSTYMYVFLNLDYKLIIAYVETWKMKLKGGKGKGIKIKYNLIIQIIFNLFPIFMYNVYYFI